MWVHIHKSMGTSVYSLSEMSGENVVRLSFNGNWWPHDTPDGSKKPINCGKRNYDFVWSNAIWGQIENRHDDQGICHEDFNNGTLLRDPNECVISKASKEAYSEVETIASLSCLEVVPATDARNEASPTKKHWKLRRFWDNFLVRTLGGEEVWPLPAGGVTELRAQKVIERLSKFDAVLFVKDFEHKAYLESAIGWNLEHYDKAYKRLSDHVVELTTEQDAQVRRTNMFDYIVLDHFRSIPMRERVHKFQ
mmetsp:Transcript_105871/g.284586  ORF Transcript_105871/g.284586 Transcript_105871/m.284586 type:complete len:250 (-) Transcript_105871:71-820(-)